MTLKFGELKILQAAEDVADGIWRQVVHWDPFIRDTIGKQLAKAADSIGANIAEAFGRYHFGEKVQFLYYARGSLFETKYWLNRVQERELMTGKQVQEYTTKLSDLARQLNTFISNLKTQQLNNRSKSKSMKDAPLHYEIGKEKDVSNPLFTDEEIQWIQNDSIPII